jgi:predicted DsbA family dithiol-disulfide isomerase
VSVTVEIWSELHCPWATTAVHRLRAARDRLGLDVVFDPRPWPLEWVNERGTPQHVVAVETAVLANVEPALFSRFAYWADKPGRAAWPSTFLPAFELVAAARRVGGPAVAEVVDSAVRRWFFGEGRDVSIRAELVACLKSADVDAAAIMDCWDRENVRADVLDDYARSRDLPIQGSPQIFWPDGTTSHNPGIVGLRWERGLPRFDRDDPESVERLLVEKVGPS